MKFFSVRLNALDLAVTAKQQEQTAAAGNPFASKNRNIEALDLAYKNVGKTPEVGKTQDVKAAPSLLSAAGENVLFPSKQRNTKELGLAFIQSMMQEKGLAIGGPSSRPGRGM